jgi:PAS domain S-box-containing protein
MARRGDPLERILGRLDDLDPGNLAILVQRLARERALLETVFNTIKEGILVVDRDGTIQYANAAACELIGLNERDVGEALLWKVMPDLARSLSWRPGKDAAAGKSRPVRAATRELEITYPERRFVRLYIMPLDAPHDSRLEDHFALILTDITEEHRSTRELIESERLDSVTMLAAGVAHEVGNPLNSINIHLQLICRQLEKLKVGPAGKKILEHADICTAEVGRLDGIIRHFLEAIRPQPPDLVKLDLLALLAEVLELGRQELENFGIRVELNVVNPLPLVLGDHNQLKQVFFNLIKNAREAMERGGLLRIEARADDNWATLAFIDTGVGITPEDLPRVFQPYFSTKRGGHGLGMMVVQRILRSHGGQIGLDSQPGRGTTVTLQFPLPERRVRLLEGGTPQVGSEGAGPILPNGGKGVDSPH